MPPGSVPSWTRPGRGRGAERIVPEVRCRCPFRPLITHLFDECIWYTQRLTRDRCSFLFVPQSCLLPAFLGCNPPLPLPSPRPSCLSRPLPLPFTHPPSTPPSIPPPTQGSPSSGRGDEDGEGSPLLLCVEFLLSSAPSTSASPTRSIPVPGPLASLSPSLPSTSVPSGSTDTTDPTRGGTEILPWFRPLVPRRSSLDFGLLGPGGHAAPSRPTSTSVLRPSRPVGVPGKRGGTESLSSTPHSVTGEPLSSCDGTFPVGSHTGRRQFTCARQGCGPSGPPPVLVVDPRWKPRTIGGVDDPRESS